jgi:hypothetical protein
MRKTYLSTTAGFLSLISSSLFWLGLLAAARFPELRFVVAIKLVYASWISAFALAIVAGISGSRKWYLATLLPAISFVAFVAMSGG